MFLSGIKSVQTQILSHIAHLTNLYLLHPARPLLYICQNASGQSGCVFSFVPKSFTQATHVLSPALLQKLCSISFSIQITQLLRYVSPAFCPKTPALQTWPVCATRSNCILPHSIFTIPERCCYISLPALSKIPGTTTHAASLPLYGIDICLKRADVYVYILQPPKSFGTLSCPGKRFSIGYRHDIFSPSQYFQNMILSAACGADCCVRCVGYLCIR